MASDAYVSTEHQKRESQSKKARVMGKGTHYIVWNEMRDSKRALVEK